MQQSSVKLAKGDCIVAFSKPGWPLGELAAAVLDISALLQPEAKVSATDRPADWALVCVGQGAPAVPVQQAAS